MTEYERNSFSPITKRETIVRAQSPYSKATGPIIREGTVAARIRAFHSAPEVNSYTGPNTGILSRVQLRPKKATSPTSRPSTQGCDNRSGYGRRKSPSFAPPASRNATIAGQQHVSLTQYRPPSSVLPGSGAGTRLQKVGNRFVVVGLEKLSQHVIFSSQAILSPRHADPEEGVGLSPSTKSVGECGLAVRDSVNNEEVSAEQNEVLKKRNIAEELSVMIDKAVDDNNSSQTKWSSDSPIPTTLDHHGQALGELNSFPPASAPLVSVVRRHSSPDYHSIAATQYSSTSSGSDHSNRHRHHKKSKHHRKCSTAEETILPWSSSDTEEDAPSLDNTAESDTTVQRHFPHIEATPASLPATISPCSPRTHAHYHGCQHHHQLPRWGTTPPRTVIGRKSNQLQEISPPRLIRLAALEQAT